jgi:hypothetical protein
MSSSDSDFTTGYNSKNAGIFLAITIGVLIIYFMIGAAFNDETEKNAKNVVPFILNKTAHERAAFYTLMTGYIPIVVIVFGAAISSPFIFM